MKKVYKRPELFYENFSLMEAIAACGFTAQHESGASCSYYDPDFDLNIFTMGLVETCEVGADFYENTHATYIFPS